MQLVDDPDAASWLDGLEGAAEDFDWDGSSRGRTTSPDGWHLVRGRTGEG